MKKASCAITEYRQLDHDLTEFLEIARRIRQLVSRAYGTESKLACAVFAAHESLFAFKHNLQELASIEHSPETFLEDFSAGLPPGYWPPQSMPGCDEQETGTLVSGLNRRTRANKCIPLTLAELKATAKALHYISAALYAVIERVDAFDSTRPAPAQALHGPWWTVGHAFTAISRKLWQVRDGK